MTDHLDKPNFTAGATSSVVPTTDPDLANKKYVDDKVAAIPAGGVTDHGLLTGLADDDHPQYVKKTGELGLPTASCALYSNWQNYVTNMVVTRVGGLVTLTGFIRWTGSNFSVTSGMQLDIAVVPVGFRPVGQAQPGIALYSITASNIMPSCRAQVDTAGVVSIWSSSAGTMPNNGGWTIINMSYPSAQ